MPKHDDSANPDSYLKKWFITAQIHCKQRLMDIPRDRIQWALAANETAPTTGRQHTHMAIVLKQRAYGRQIQDWINYKCDLRKLGGSRTECMEYFTKEDPEILSIGEEIPSRRGQRTDIEAVHDAINNNTPWETILSTHTDTVTRHYNSFHKIYLLAQQSRDMQMVREELNGLTLNDKQTCILSNISTNRRHINWFYDRVGGIGKSTLGEYMTAFMNGIVFEGTIKLADAMYMYNGEEYVIFDLARTMDVDYAVLETFTRRYITSTKYECVKKICKAKVVVFSNSPPNETCLSQDRWNILEL